MNIDYCKLGLAVIENEARAISRLSSEINENFSKACELLEHCKGRIIVMGMGKSGHIGNKIAATLASTGSPAFFVHPAEASHGDLGMITADDVIIAISYSGNAHELLLLLPVIKRLGLPLLAITGNPSSPLALAADTHLNVHVEQEACPLGLAPTSSTTATLVMGDALAVALLQSKGFSSDDFALSHPGGTLGRRLLLRVDTLCHQGADLPTVSIQATLAEALIEITEKKLGMTCVINHRGELTGVITDGDIRRCLTQELNIHTTRCQDVMTTDCQTIPMTLLAAEAINLMENNKITSLVIVNDKQTPLGVIHLHDLLKAGA